MVELNLEPESVVSITSNQGVFTSTEVKAPNQSHSFIKRVQKIVYQSVRVGNSIPWRRKIKQKQNAGEERYQFYHQLLNTRVFAS